MTPPWKKGPSNQGPARRPRIARRPTHIIQPADPRPQRRDCQGQLLAALAEMAGPDSAIADAGMRPWCSATFVGAQHRIMLHVAGEDAARQAATLTAGLGETAFTLHGHIVADISVDAVRETGDGAVSVSLAVLTIEDW